MSNKWLLPSAMFIARAAGLSASDYDSKKRDTK
jgi:hypothetical protein